MRPLLLIPVLAAASLLAACATDGAPAPRLQLAQGGDPCQLDAPLELTDPRAESVFGCATARNLRLMVADPRDLEHGADLPAPRGDAAIQPAARLRLRQAATPGAESTGGMAGPSAPSPESN